MGYRRVLAVALVLALSLAACGSTVSPVRRAPSSAAGEAGIDGSAADDATNNNTRDTTAPRPQRGGTSAKAAEATVARASARAAAGVPVTIGIISTNNDAAPAAGVDNGTTFSPRRAFEGYVAAWNARGGLAGRKIVPIYVELRSSSVSLDSDLQAACSTFTQDNHVAVVLSAIGLYSETLAQCLAKARTPQITGDYSLGDVTSIAQTPLLFALSTMTIDDRMRLLLEHTAAARRLTSADKLGVVVEGCPFDARAYDRTVVPTARRLGLTIADHVESRCFESISDLGGLGSDMAAAVLRFRRSGVTKVVFVSGSVEGNMVFLFLTAADSQGWHPGYALTSTAAPVVQETNTPKGQLANAFGFGWLPALDRTKATATLPAGQGCLKDLQAGAGIAPASPTDRYDAFSICDLFGFANATSIATAVSGIGTSFLGAATYGEKTDFRGGRRTGPAQGRLFAWSTGCGCFDYTGQAFSLTA